MSSHGFRSCFKKRNGVGGLLTAVKHSICSSIMVQDSQDSEFAQEQKCEFGQVVVCEPQENDHIDQINNLFLQTGGHLRKVTLFLWWVIIMLNLVKAS